MSKQVIKRNSESVNYDAEKIKKAIRAAFEDEKVNYDEKIIKNITDNVEKSLEKQYYAKGHTPSVENVQDSVEHSIDDAGFFVVAKSYILFRYKKSMERDGSIIHVIKRDGTKVPFDMDEVYARLKLVTNGSAKKVAIDTEQILKEVRNNIFDGITTKEVDKALIMVLRARLEKDPEFALITSRALWETLYKEVLGKSSDQDGWEKEYGKSLKSAIEKGLKDDRYDKKMLNFDFDKLSKAMDYSKDKLFKYLGAQVLYDRYFIKNYNQEVLELPQVFWMRVSMGLALNEDKKEERAIEFYNVFSDLRYVASTPTLFHSGTSHAQMSSCYLNYVDDDLEHIFKVYGDHAQLSKWSGGIGTSWSAIRGTGALIKATNVGSQGVIPFLKIADSTTAAINRSGKRRGAAAVYLETWHYDIEAFLDLRKNTGDDRRRTHDMNTVNWIPDLFMKRVRDGGQWTLFSTDEAPGLHDTYGKEFEKKYLEYEKMADEGKIKLFKRIEAMNLWRKMITMLFESGHPWITFKDPCNVRSPQDHVGVVHSSNLCTEITLNTSRDETAVCNLGSINMASHMKKGKLDEKKIAETVKVAMRMLDNVIDLNFYPTKEAKNSNMKHRPVGLGMMGLQDAIYMQELDFDSKEAIKFSDIAQELISYHAILASSELAAERGSYESYKGSKWDRDIFPLDTLDLLAKERGEEIEIDREATQDWSIVRASVKKNGMRNSNTMAIAPTATISNISGIFPCIEPAYKNLYVKSNFSGEFTILNEYLVNDLKKLNLWNDEMIKKLKYYDGSVQQILEIPEKLRNKYKEAFEVGTDSMIDHAAARAKWLDQSQSLNIFTSSTSGRVLSDTYFKAWRMGVKTTYYLRTMGATSVEKSTVGLSK